MEEKGDLGDFGCGVVVDEDLVIFWDVPMKPSGEFTEDGLKKKKISSELCLSLDDTRGEWSDCFKLIGTQQ